MTYLVSIVQTLLWQVILGHLFAMVQEKDLYIGHMVTERFLMSKHYALKIRYNTSDNWVRQDMTFWSSYLLKNWSILAKH